MKETEKALMKPEDVKELNNKKFMDKVNKDTSKLTNNEMLKLILIELIKLNKKIR